MSKKEFHYIYSNSGSEYSWKFEIQSKIGRVFLILSSTQKWLL